jgi:hypothetical protein
MRRGESGLGILKGLIYTILETEQLTGVKMIFFKRSYKLQISAANSHSVSSLTLQGFKEDIS